MTGTSDIPTYLAIDIGGTFTKYAIMTSEGEIRTKSKIPTALDDLETFLTMLTNLYEANHEVRGIAISSAGMIDSDRGFMYNGGAMHFIENLDLVGVLKERCKVPVSIENDAKAAALAELWKGSLQECRNAVAMIIGTGIGGAIIVDRKVLRGSHCMAGEFSYVFNCGNQTDGMDRVLGGNSGMPHLISEASLALEIPKEELSGERLFSLALSGNEVAQNCIRNFAKRLAVQINNYQFIVDPEKIAIGGGVSTQPLLLQYIREELRNINSIFPYAIIEPEVTACSFFNDSNLIGALYVHLKQQGSLE